MLETLLIAFVVIFGGPAVLLIGLSILGFLAFSPVAAVLALARWRPSRAQLQAVGKPVLYFAVAVCPVPLAALFVHLVR